MKPTHFSTSLDDIVQSYEKHPQNGANIIRRLRHQDLPLKSIVETDLAIDPTGQGMTDQNHAGGLEVIQSFGGKNKLNSKHSVLEVGAGLGGVCRGLSHLYGCSTTGIELAHCRYLDSLNLTRMVGLESLVTMIHGDFMTLEIEETFDFVLFISTLVHFATIADVLKRVRLFLKPGGTILIQETFLLREPTDALEKSSLKRLDQLWNSTLVTLSSLKEDLYALDFENLEHEDLSAFLDEDINIKLNSLSVLRSGTIVDSEAEAWELSARLRECGLIGYLSVSANLRGTTGNKCQSPSVSRPR